METAVNSSRKFSRKFLLLWSGQLISVIGSGLTSFGLGIYVFEQTGKASAMALVTLLAFMPSLLLSRISLFCNDAICKHIPGFSCSYQH
ncbi:hypothetical protein J2S08_004324 [Bacillus chungangensis]|uniref:MFS transporter n=1 Tax=Bacillus chungangensis TaxID=587633 RepID=A0ABT9WYP4_9BACI|nr:hypothetical protein [Bacillus chungangensis]